MAQNSSAPAKDIILIVGLVDKSVITRYLHAKKNKGWNYRFALAYPNKPLSKDEEEVVGMVDIQIPCNFDSHKSLTQALQPYEDQLLVATARGEGNIPHFQKIIPHIPYLQTPTTESLQWATSKIEMRRRLSEYDKKLSPEFMLVHDASKTTLTRIKEEIGFPLIIKPTGLAESLLVTIAFHEEELIKSLRRILRKIRAQHKKWDGRGEPEILVEQFMEGDIYSIDVYVDSRGDIFYCPLVDVKTGRSIGFDDFFGYQQMIPTALSKESAQFAQGTAYCAVRALKLRSTTVHIELMRTENGWKVIELGPRIGGFRDTLYQLAYGIDHGANDLAIRMSERPILPKQELGHAVAMKFFARQEGKITNLIGLKKAQELESFHHIIIQKQIGDRSLYAKHGGKSVFNIFLFNQDRSKLLADIHRLEQMVKIEIASKAAPS